MKKIIFSIAIVLSIASTVFCQQTQKELLTQKWKYIGTEEFGVVKLDSLAKNDWLLLNTDGTYEWMKAGKSISGTWSFNETAKIISFTSSTKKNLNYNLKKVNATDLTLEYQTPDLVRTKYRYHVVTE
ncbi:MAG: hypothetical protein LH473_00210 [Chitinophagales bacterium]|nr:hypothetical protein [Chitinophagales bacterium]